MLYRMFSCDICNVYIGMHTVFFAAGINTYCVACYPNKKYTNHNDTIMTP